jgi:hypothetical protein
MMRLSLSMWTQASKKKKKKKEGYSFKEIELSLIIPERFPTPEARSTTLSI